MWVLQASEPFNNETGGRDVVWHWYSARKREIQLSFMNPVPNAVDSTLRLDNISPPFQVESSSAEFTFMDVDNSWT